MSELRAFLICLFRPVGLEPVLYAVPEGALVGLDLYDKVGTLLPDFINDALLHRHCANSHNLPFYVQPVEEFRHGCYLVALLMALFRVQGDADDTGIFALSYEW